MYRETPVTGTDRYTGTGPGTGTGTGVPNSYTDLSQKKPK